MANVRKVAVAVLALGVGATPLRAAGESVPQICASRIYDGLHRPVKHFSIDFQRSELIGDDVYDTYKAALTAAAVPLGYDANDRTFTLHELLSTFPFLYYGRVLSLNLDLCAAGREGENVCRRAEYYITDRQFDAARLSLILMDTLIAGTPAPVAACTFGAGEWADVG